MSKEIAVFINKKGLTASMDEAGSIKIYQKSGDGWEVNKELPFLIDHDKGIKGVRDSINELVTFLGKCKVFVGREVTGILYNNLDVNGVGIIEMDGVPEKFLDYVLKQEEEYEKLVEGGKEELDTLPHPIESKKEGYYSMNLKLLSIDSPNVTSKQALIPFLSNNKFYELEVICGHFPRWFETELPKLNLKYETIKESETQYKVIIYPKTCNEK